MLRAMSQGESAGERPIAPTGADWREHGVSVIPAGQLDPNTAQTPGMNRAAAINFARVGARKLWAGTVRIDANAKTCARERDLHRQRPGTDALG
jgi:uncharacterized RmlC-like cupin family protein